MARQVRLRNYGRVDPDRRYFLVCMPGVLRARVTALPARALDEAGSHVLLAIALGAFPGNNSGRRNLFGRGSRGFAPRQRNGNRWDQNRMKKAFHRNMPLVASGRALNKAQITAAMKAESNTT